MKILIESNYIGWESNIIQKGSFLVPLKDYKKNPDKTAAKIAHKWINEIRGERNLVVISIY